MDRSNSKTVAIAVAVAAGALAIPTVGRYVLGRRRAASRSAATEDAQGPTTPVEEWSAENVSQWLRSRGLSESAISALKQNEVDGSVLRHVTDAQLIQAGVNLLRDRVLFERSIALLPFTTETVPTAPPPQAPAAKPSPQRPTVTSEAPAEVKMTEHQAQAFTQILQAIRSIERELTSDAYQQSSSADRRALLGNSMQQIMQLFPLLETLPPAAAAQLANLCTSLGEVMESEYARAEEEGRTAASRSPAAAAARTVPVAVPVAVVSPSQLAATSRALSPLAISYHTVLDQYAELLSKPALRAAPAAQRENLVGGIASEVNKIADLIDRLPEHEQAAVGRKLLVVGNALRDCLSAKEERRNPPVAPRQEREEADEEGENESSQLAAVLVDKLISIHELAREMATSSTMSEGDQRGFLERASLEVNRILQAAEQLPTPRDAQMISTLATKVGQLLKQLREIVNMRGASAKPSASNERARGGADISEAPETAGGETDEQAKKVSAALRTIIHALQSPDFLTAPVAVREKILEAMQTTLQEADEAVRSMPPRHAQQLGQFVDRAKELIGSLSAGAQQTRGASKATAAAGATGDEDDGTHEQPWAAMMRAGAKQEPINDAALATYTLNSVVSEVEEIFALLSSDPFKKAPAERKASVAERVLPRLEALRDQLSVVDRAQAVPLYNVIDSLERSLQTAIRLGADGKGSGAAQEAKSASREESSSSATTPSKARDAGASAPTTRSQPAAAQKTAPPSVSAAEATDAFSVAMNGLNQVFEIMSSPQFRGAPRQVQEEIAKNMITHVKRIKSVLSSLDPAQRAHAAPLFETIDDTLRTIAQIADASVDDEGNDEAAQDGPKKGRARAPAPSSRNPPSDSTADKAKQSELEAAKTRILDLHAFVDSAAYRTMPVTKKHRVGVAILGELLDLQQIVARGGGPDGKAAAALAQEAILAVRRAAGDAAQEASGSKNEDDEENDKNADTSGDDDDDDDDVIPPLAARQQNTREPKPFSESDEPAEEMKATSAAEAAKEEKEEALEGFIVTLASIKERLDAAEVTSSVQLVPYVSIIESALHEADREQIPWRVSATAVRLVSELMATVRETQQRLESGEEAADQTSSVAHIVNEAKQAFLDSPPQNVEELQPYVNLLRKLHTAQDHLTMADLTAFKELQEVVSEHSEKLLSEASKQANEDQNEQIQGLLLELSTRLRDEELPLEVLEWFESLLAKMETVEEPSEDVSEMIQSVRSQINLQKLNREKEAQEQWNETEAQQAKEPKNTQQSAAADEADAIKTNETASVASTNNSHSKVDMDVDDSPEEGVPGGTGNALTLLVRIEERLSQEESVFVARSSLFDIQCISKVLLHLSSSKMVNSVPQLKTRVVNVKKLFARQLEAFEGHTQDQCRDVAPLNLNLTGKASMSEDGAPREWQFTIFSDEDAGSFNVDQSFIKRVTNAGAERVAPQLSIEEAKSWAGRSVAVIVYIPSYGATGHDTKTALTELVLLHDQLSKRHGFEVLCVTDRATNADAVGSILELATSSQPKRLLVLFYTPTASDTAPSPTRAVTFMDGSELTHQTVVDLVPAVERVVVLHCTPRALEVLACANGKTSPQISLELTPSAAKAVLTRRRWLFDGVLAPTLIELLDDADERVLCPEDLVNFAASIITRENVCLGGHTDDDTAGMAFFATKDALAKLAA